MECKEKTTKCKAQYFSLVLIAGKYKISLWNMTEMRNLKFVMENCPKSWKPGCCFWKSFLFLKFHLLSNYSHVETCCWEDTCVNFYGSECIMYVYSHAWNPGHEKKPWKSTCIVKFYLIWQKTQREVRLYFYTIYC